MGNTGMFSQVWKQISAEGTYQNADWVLKVDADAIFVPNRMRVWFKQNERVPPAGIYLENCKYVDYGYFGNLEVFSRQAFSTLIDNIDSCKSTLDWKVGIKDGKYGPMGEDLFAQTCLDSVGADARRPSTSRQMALAQLTGQRRRGRTRSGSPIALGRPLQRCILSRKQRSGSSATRPPLLPSGHRSRAHSFFSTCGALRCSAAENSQLRASLHSSSSVIIDDAALPT